MKNQPYNFAEIESKWGKIWEKEAIYKTQSTDKGNKMYTLVMFPYPSGAGLHTGHARVYTGTDVLARFYRMNGNDVLHPMGWDAFGLPTENAAIKEKKKPADVTKKNIANFKRQMKMLGISYDWSKEINTTDPDYYARTQWLFIQFFKHGLLYKKDTPVYYCEFCKTGLAQEEVMGDGTHERCGNQVVKKNLPQWIFRITTYADSLLKGLEGLDWPKGILEMQKNWIGKKEGIEITYDVKSVDGKKTIDTITCFTTTPVNYGATFIVLAPDHPFVSRVDNKEVQDYVRTALEKTERERMKEGKKKTGVFTGFNALNHVTGDLMPIWVSDFVLSNVGTGAVQGCPGHDARDFEFAQKFGLPIIKVVSQDGKMINSDFLDGMSFKDAMVKTMDYFEEKGWGKRVVSYHLRDWIFSRQRYWGEPIPMVFCESCAKNKIGGLSDSRLTKAPFKKLVDDISGEMHGWFPLSEENLPLKLPEVTTYEPTESGESPLASIPKWVKTECPHCKGPAKRETDTMPNWAGSCWYFLAFPLAKEGSKFDISDKEMTEWLPVNWYIGGAEHAVLHLLYSRFWIHALNDMGILPFREPFTRLRNVGMVIAEDRRKMSKSWGNVINPDDIGEKFGIDALRAYEMFMAPFNQEVVWSTQTLQGVSRFLARIWQTYNSSARITKLAENYDKKLVSELQKVIQKITSDIPDVKFNTPIATLMEFLNTWEHSKNSLPESYAKQYLQLLAPFAPFMTEEIWREIFKEKESIHLSTWPKTDVDLIQSKEVMIPVQIDGKVRDMIKLGEVEYSEKELVDHAQKLEKVEKWLKGKKIDKIIYIPGKIISIATIAHEPE